MKLSIHGTEVFAKGTEAGTSGNSNLSARNWLDGIYDTTPTYIKYPVFKGKTVSMNYISAGDAYKICRAMTDIGNIYGLNDNNADSHLIKNSEWGAVVYLTKSQYGLGATDIKINNVSLNSGNTSTLNDYSSIYAITGYVGNSANAPQNTVSSLTELTNTLGTSSAWDTTEGGAGSTTGNITGVFDMSGGLKEITTGYIANANAKASGNTSAFSTLDISTKYATIYPFNVSSNLNTNIFGDAIMETPYWNNDQGGYFELEKFVLARGGDFSQAGSAGLTAFESQNGFPSYNTGFRAVLIKL